MHIKDTVMDVSQMGTACRVYTQVEYLFSLMCHKVPSNKGASRGAPSCTRGAGTRHLCFGPLIITHQGDSRLWPRYFGFCHTGGKPDGLLASSWPILGCCEHLGDRTSRGKVSPSLPPSFPHPHCHTNISVCKRSQVF